MHKKQPKVNEFSKTFFKEFFGTTYRTSGNPLYERVSAAYESEKFFCSLV